MKHRKLRIVWSVAWGLACVAPIAVWLRGYSSAGFPAVWHGHTFRFASGNLLVDETIQSVPQRISDANYELGDATGRWGVTLNTTVMVPHHTVPAWSAVPILAVIVILPWLSWSTRFSLRTLLIATTLVAVGLGLIVWAAK
jgi:hypothetical protein